MKPRETVAEMVTPAKRRDQIIDDNRGRFVSFPKSTTVTVTETKSSGTTVLFVGCAGALLFLLYN